jgi:hypothetical protein
MRYRGGVPWYSASINGGEPNPLAVRLAFEEW